MDKNKKQERTIGWHDGGIKLRANPDGGATMIIGTAIVYERESEPIYGMYVEVIKRDALKDADMTRVVARTGHDDNNLLGTTMGGTLRLRDSAEGLHYEVDIPDTTAGRDTQVYMERGDIQGSSFAFISDHTTEVWTEREGQLPLLEIYNIKGLYDVSPVINPAYRDSSSALRGFNAWEESKETEKTAAADKVVKERELKADSDSLLALHKHKKITR
jgi:HK97 family phage prohead protease